MAILFKNMQKKKTKNVILLPLVGKNGHALKKSAEMVGELSTDVLSIFWGHRPVDQSPGGQKLSLAV